MATTSNPVQARLHAVRERIAKACEQAGRSPDSVTLVAVSKTFPADAVKAAALAGQCDFGENYVQEAVAKIAAIGAWTEAGARPLAWHFIGPIQSNKTRPIAEHFQWVHSIDRVKVAERLSEQRRQSMGGGLPALQACIQVNVSGEASKSGIDPRDLHTLAAAVSALPGLKLRGLMTVPEPTPDQALQRLRFAELRRCRDRLAAAGILLDTLSMGMSADLEAAIAEGATMVRVGTAIFGERNQ